MAGATKNDKLYVRVVLPGTRHDEKSTSQFKKFWRYIRYSTVGVVVGLEYGR